ncbi:MAG: nucleotidyl transferase AbiEii/AbiGii toxin family protein [Chloroflexi bacterium]|nr:nucleotidyl transferase AbiEii/AbiGii toxin family protein [Chloroflexota bacterium]MBI5828085.1 nucleotidyl transferase AbiEii/AbiGii toxin family protein [Chloroflexota bacterium]
MFSAGTLTFREFAMQEQLPLAAIQNAVLEFLRGRDDAAVFGAQAVNAYVPEPRMTQDIDLISPRAAEFAEELREHLSRRFHVTTWIREIGEGRGYRLYQIQKSGNRHLVDVRPVEPLPATQRIAEVLVIAPADLIASKVIAYHQRRGHPKSGTDWRDLAMLLLTFPDLKRDPGPVTDRLKAADVAPAVLAVWKELVAQEIQSAEEDDEF